jgi:hypothetical protein
MPFDMFDDQLQAGGICSKSEKALEYKIQLWDEHFRTLIF